MPITPERAAEIREDIRRRKELAAQTREESGDDRSRAMEFIENTPVGISQALGLPVDVVNAVLSFIPGYEAHENPALGSKHIQSMLAKAGMSPEVGTESDTAFGRAGRFAGSAAVPAAGLPGAMARGVTTQTMRQAALPRGATQIDTRGVARSVAEDVTRGAVARPKTYLAAETSAAAGAGGAGSYIEETETYEQVPEPLRPTVKILAETVAGLGGTLAPTTAVNLVNRAAKWGMENMFSWTGPGSMNRAANQMQRRATEDPRESARRVLDSPDDISPARATGDKSLMGQEARVIADDNVFESEYREGLINAARRAERSMRDIYGTPEGKQDWERAVIERVSAPGTSITPGFTDEMLEEAADSFSILYDPIKERRMKLQLVRPSRKTELRTLLENATKTKRIQIGPKKRKQVNDWIMDRYKGLARQRGRRKDEGYVTAGDLIEFRSKLRTEARKYARTDPERARLHEHAVDKVTEVITSQLNPADRASLRAADRLYRQFKIVFDASKRAGPETGLTPKSLVSEVRKATSHHRSAKNRERDLLAAAQAGRPVAQVLNKPHEATIMARDLTPDQINNKHAEFVETIMDKATGGKDNVIRGTVLKDLLDSNEKTAKALKMTDEDFQRLQGIADEFVRIQENLPRAYARLMDDGPSSVFELLVVLQSAKGASTISDMRGVGMGGGMVIAQYMTNKARRTLESITGDKAEALLRAAHKDKKLYAALLTRNTDPVSKKQAAAKTLQSWLLPAGQELEDDISENREDIDDLKRLAQELGVQ